MFLFVNPQAGVRVTASSIWVGVEHLPIEALRQAARHPRPVFCGRLAACDARRDAVEVVRRAVNWPGGEPEWHEAEIGTTIGQGAVLDLLRQRWPVEEVILVQPQWQADLGSDSGLGTTAEESAYAREVLDGLLVVTRGAAASLDTDVGSGMRVLVPKQSACDTPLVAGLSALVDQFIVIEAENWAARGMSLRCETLSSALNETF